MHSSNGIWCSCKKTDQPRKIHSWRNNCLSWPEVSSVFNLSLKSQLRSPQLFLFLQSAKRCVYVENIFNTRNLNFQVDTKRKKIEEKNKIYHQHWKAHAWLFSILYSSSLNFFTNFINWKQSRAHENFSNFFFWDGEGKKLAGIDKNHVQ